MRARLGVAARSSLLFATALAVVAVLPAVARGQDISCDRENAREVRSLRFEGNTTFKSDVLSAFVVTTPSSVTRRYFGWFFHAGTARCLPADDGLIRDVENLKTLYKNNGFYATKIDTVITPLSPQSVRVTFRINEGPPLLADSVTITGLDSVPDRRAILHDLQSQVGSRVGQFQMHADIDTITARLRNAGYPRVDVFSAFHTPAGHERAEIELNVVTGPRTRIGTIDIQRVSAREGQAPGIDSATVLGLLGFRSGNWYSDRSFTEATRNLYNLGAYRHVGITLDGPDSTTQAADTVAGVLVDVREDFLRQVQLEEGWGSLDCFRVDGQYTDKNFLDRAWRLDLTTRASKIGYGTPTNTRATRNLCYRPQLDQDSIGSSKLNYYVGATVRQPTLFGGHWVPAYSAYTERRGEYKAYLRTTFIGADVSTTRNIALNLPFRVGYTFEFGQTQAEAAELCAVFNRCNADTVGEIQGRKRFAVASASLQQAKTDNAVDPRSGIAWASEFRIAGPWIGTDSALTFKKVTGDFSWYHSLTSRVTLATRVRGGYIAGGSGFIERGSAPPQERLYAGGAQSVRGFNQNELGPLVYLVDFNSFAIVPLPSTFGKDTSTVALVAFPNARAVRTVPVGGNALVVLNAELRIRDPFFPELLEYVPFLDAGQLWTRDQAATQDINEDRLVLTPGLGIRYFSPVGPIQLNVGYNRSKTRAGPAFWAAPVDNIFTPSGPLLCVTPPSSPVVPVLVVDGKFIRNTKDCSSDFSPFKSSNFFNRLVFTVSIGNAF